MQSASNTSDGNFEKAEKSGNRPLTHGGEQKVNRNSQAEGLCPQSATARDIAAREAGDALRLGFEPLQTLGGAPVVGAQLQDLPEIPDRGRP